MADLSIAIAGLIAEFSKPQDAVFSPRDALEEVWNALDQLNANPHAVTQLRNQVNEASRAGQLHLNGTPLVLLKAMLQTFDDQGGPRHG